MTGEGHEPHSTHNDAVCRAKGFMPSASTVGNLSDFFKLFGDPTRMRILLALDSGEMCVCCLSETLGMSMSAVSHQLRILRDAHLISYRKEGRSVYYRLCDDHVKVVLETALEHIEEGREDR